MITDSLLQFALSFVRFLIDLLPSGTGFPIALDTAVTVLSSVVHVFDIILPTYVLFDIMLFLLTVRLAIFTFHFVMWLKKVLSPFN